MDIRLLVSGKHGRVVLDRADDIDEARALAVMYVTDPRDSIREVYLYDEAQAQFRGWVTPTTVARMPKRRRAACKSPRR